MIETIIHQIYIRRKRAYLQYQKNNQIKINNYRQKLYIKDQYDISSIIKNQYIIGSIIEEPFFEFTDIYETLDGNNSFK